VDIQVTNLFWHTERTPQQLRLELWAMTPAGGVTTPGYLQDVHHSFAPTIRWQGESIWQHCKSWGKSFQHTRGIGIRDYPSFFWPSGIKGTMLACMMFSRQQLIHSAQEAMPIFYFL
jgi:hypothetical protein